MRFGLSKLGEYPKYVLGSHIMVTGHGVSEYYPILPLGHGWNLDEIFMYGNKGFEKALKSVFLCTVIKTL